MQEAEELRLSQSLACMCLHCLLTLVQLNGNFGRDKYYCVQSFHSQRFHCVMCIPVEGQNRLCHECILGCPIYWIFLYLAKDSLVRGHELQLGTVADLMRAGESGCQLAHL
jgi:hypothetical protein